MPKRITITLTEDQLRHLISVLDNDSNRIANQDDTAFGDLPKKYQEAVNFNIRLQNTLAKNWNN